MKIPSHLHHGTRCVGAFVMATLILSAVPVQAASSGFTSRADTPPRKVVVATLMAKLSGDPAQRARAAAAQIDAAALEAARRYPHNGLDLVVLPEYALQADSGRDALTRAVGLHDSAVLALSAKAREYQTWIVVPMILREEGPEQLATNAAVLLDRAGAVAGIYRKVHPVADGRGILEGGVTPGTDFRVFNCDFGRLGILICYDMSYPEAWQAMAAGGAEIVAVPSASPQTLRTSASALQHRFHVVTSTPRDNASMFDPMGMTIAQTTEAPVLVHEIDLAFATLHWTADLDNGRALTRRFGDRVGYRYSVREDTGVFWSNDPGMSIGQMIRQLGLREMPRALEFSREAQDKARRPVGFPRPERQ
jgi:predicted amidohydrolase